MTFGSRVMELRRQRGLNQSTLAKQAGMACSNLSRLERGEYLLPRLSHAQALAEALGVPLEQLLRTEEADGATSAA